jgi:hypothetical protein
MNRYREAVDRIRPVLESDEPGSGLLIVPPTEAEIIARAVADVIGGGVAALSPDLLQTVSGRLVGWIPVETEDATISALNDLRMRIAARGSRVIVLATRHQLLKTMSRAGDWMAVLRFTERIPFVADPSIDVDDARRRLAEWQRERFGRLDLRGFVRSESEDLSWPVEMLYQHAKVELADTDPSHQEPDGSSLVRQLQLARERQPGVPVVILGHPGTGKSYFLRWAALQAAGRNSFLGIDRPIPVLASLAPYATTPGPVSLHEYLIETLLQSESSAAHALQRCIHDRRVLFLLDGLDEVGDATTRARVVAEIRRLCDEARGCLVVVTSRIAGYQAASLDPDARTFALAPFDSDDIRAFLRSWCTLYARDVHGMSQAAQQRGERDGQQIADEVLANPRLRGLARNPLLLTVIAIVHRTGVHLPDHRVELYEHATRILVERWNRVRGLEGERTAVPLKAPDAVRLLGPLALESLRSGRRASISESALRKSLEATLARGAIGGLSSTDDALAMFKQALGLLVEVAPQQYSFLHLTLGEYFAAWELVRSDGLERLISTGRALNAESREVLLLAAGILGVLRADDARLRRVVELVIRRARALRGSGRATVPTLLSGLLADDIGLSAESIRALIDELVPSWWFGTAYDRRSFDEVLMNATEAARRVRERPRVHEALHRAIRAHFDPTVDPPCPVELLGWYAAFLGEVRLDIGPLLRRWVDEGNSHLTSYVLRAHPVGLKLPAPFWQIPISRHLRDLATTGEHRMSIEVTTWGVREVRRYPLDTVEISDAGEPHEVVARIDDPGSRIGFSICLVRSA